MAIQLISFVFNNIEHNKKFAFSNKKSSCVLIGTLKYFMYERPTIPKYKF